MMASPDEKRNGLEMNSDPPPSQNGKSAHALEAGEVRPTSPPVATAESEAEKRKQEKIKKKPLWYCRMVTNYPRAAFFITLGLHILMLAIMGILFRVGYDIFPITFDRIPLSILDNEEYLNFLAWSQRNENDNIVERLSGDSEDQAEGSQLREIVQWIYESEEGNVFTQSNLQAMKEAEESIYTITDFQEKYCYRPAGICSKPNSVLRFFDGTYSDVDPDFDNSDFSDYINVLNKANTYNETISSLQSLVGVGYEFTSSKAKSHVLRASIAIGFPLEGYKNDEDDEDGQDEKLKTYMLDTFKNPCDDFYDDGVGDMNFVYTSGTLISVSITGFVFRDIALILGSILIIFIFMCIQTGSLWLTLFALLSIVTSFCATNLVYRIILDYRYIGIFHVLALFIILGIGADDVFVFVDTWKETSHNSYPSLAHRLSHCYRRASLAMLYTSLTTAIAFIVSATSPFLGINSFGVFAGLLVLVNYLSVIIYYPTVVVMYHLYFEKFKCCCCCPKKKHDPTVDDMNKSPEEAAKHQRKNIVVRFFRTHYYNFVTHKVARWFILGFFVIIFTVFLYFTTQIEVNEEQVEFLPDSTNIGKFIKLNANDFDTGENPQTILLVFGLKKQDLDSCHKTDPDCQGKTVWDDEFSLNTDGSQQAILDLCDTLKGLDDGKIDDLKIRKNAATSQPEVSCFMQNLADFLDAEGDRMVNTPTAVRRYPVGTQFSLPLGEGQVRSIMSNVTYIYNETLLSDSFSNWFEIGASFWLYNGFQPGVGLSDDFNDFTWIVGEETQDSTITNNVDIANFSLSYKYANRLRYAAIVVNTTINPNILGYPKGLAIRDDWEDFFSEQLSDMPSSLKGGFQVAGNDLWHWLNIQKTLVSSAVTGVAIGIALAFPILVISTMNIIVGSLATLTIACITVSVTGLIPILGWKLGFLESLNLVLLVGLAVDYCVHMAEGYSRSVHRDRKSRVRDALEEVGISVLSGACTSLGASFFLLFATILFFTQFGIFMFCTIALSMLYSLGFFVTLLGLIGPQNDFGSLWPLIDKCTACCCKNKRKSEDIQQPNTPAKF